MKDLINLFKFIALFLVSVVLMHYVISNYACIITQNPQSFQCFMAKGIVIFSDQKLRDLTVIP